MCITSAKIKWVKSFLDQKEAVWKYTLEHLCKKENLSLFLQINYDVKELSCLPKYYIDSFIHGKEVKNESIITKLYLNNQFFCYNNNIKLKEFCEFFIVRTNVCILFNLNIFTKCIYIYIYIYVCSNVDFTTY